MLDYEWNILTGAVAVDEPTAPSDHHRHLFDHYSQTFNDTTHYHNNNNNNHNNNNNNNNNNLNPNNFLHHHHNHNHQYHLQPHPNFTPFYDPRAFSGDCTYAPSSPSGLLPLDPPEASAVPYMLLPKTEPSGCAIDFTNNRIGLNLGGRTYFSSAEDDFVNRLYRRSRPLEAAALVTSPRCQAEGCNADLTNAKHYHRRHKVCEFHSKASTVITAGLTQRFCQQCSRFHLLSEFDNGKRSCRKRLADHNRRRRKSSQNHDHSKSVITVTSTQSSSSEIISRYQSDSRV